MREKIHNRNSKTEAVNTNQSGIVTNFTTTLEKNDTSDVYGNTNVKTS